MHQADYLVPRERIDKIIQEHRSKPGALLTILEAIQEANRYRYLPKETLIYLGQQMDETLANIYSVVTFYAFFNMEPQGKHTITVCRGTACHARGSKRLLDRVCHLLKVDLKQYAQSDQPFITTPDLKYTIRTVACFGQCAQAPIIGVNEEIYGYVTEDKLRKIIDELDQEHQNED